MDSSENVCSQQYSVVDAKKNSNVWLCLITTWFLSKQCTLQADENENTHLKQYCLNDRIPALKLTLLCPCNSAAG